MIFYSYEKLWALGFGNSEIMVKAFNELVAGTEGYEVLTGESFILNPHVVTQNPNNLTYQQLAEYLGICSLRNYQTYKTTGSTDIDMAYIPNWIQPSVIKEHPLLKLTKSNINLYKENKT